MDRLALIKQIAEKKAKEKAEEQSFQESIRRLDARKAAIKKEQKEKKKLHTRLTRSMKKAGHQSVGNLELNAPENMYYSDKDTARFLENSPIMDAYNANKFADGDY